MPRSNTQSSVSRAWLARFVEELHAVAQAREVAHLVGSSVTFVDSPMRIVDPGGWPRGTGWFVDVARIRRVGGSLSVWLDRYLDINGDAHLGVWYQSNAKHVHELADILNVPPQHRYTWDHRNENGMLMDAYGRRERARFDSWVVDEWSPREAYLGKYVKPSPYLQNPRDVIGSVCGAFGVLAQTAVHALTPSSRTVENDNDQTYAESERYWSLVARLARPNQTPFRNGLLRAFKGRCAITGCATRVVLDAAHIKPVADFGADHVDNGLLLRADLHRLFDAGLISISGERQPRVMVAAELLDGQYGEFSTRTLAAELTVKQRANLSSRNLHWTDDGLSTRGVAV